MQLQELINKLGLIPLPEEGGMYCPTYAGEKVQDRPVGTAIYYLLSGNAFSHLHLLDADEIYHFYLGDPVELFQLDDNGILTRSVLGNDIASGQQLQLVIPRGVWQGSRLVNGGCWALMGTTMAPGYTDACYTHGHREELTARFPQHAAVIKSLTGEVVFL